MKIKKTKIYGWNGYRMDVPGISLGVVPDLGGRILSLKYKGEELFYVQRKFRGRVFDFSKACDLQKEKKKVGFQFWGGDKTWVAPESDWINKIPPLELDCGKYATRVDNDKLVMTSPVCRETKLQIIREVSVNCSGRIVLKETFVNKGDVSIKKGIWNVTQLVLSLKR